MPRKVQEEIDRMNKNFLWDLQMKRGIKWYLVTNNKGGGFRLFKMKIT